MTIRLSERSTESMLIDLQDHYAQVIRYQAEEMVRTEKYAREAVLILRALSEVLPLMTTSYWDLQGSIVLKLDRVDSVRILNKLRDAGYVFGDATYTLACKDTDGNDQVNVRRGCVEVVSGLASPHAVDRLYVEWIAPYVGGHKCRIVETVHAASTSRSLTCEK